MQKLFDKFGFTPFITVFIVVFFILIAILYYARIEAGDSSEIALTTAFGNAPFILGCFVIVVFLVLVILSDLS